jgi:hypothetical protein
LSDFLRKEDELEHGIFASSPQERALDCETRWIVKRPALPPRSGLASPSK